MGSSDFKENERVPEVRPAEESSSYDQKGISTFEDLLELAGTRGRWNILMFFLCSMCAFISPLQTLSYQFLGATPDYWCRVDPLLEGNWTQEQVRNFAIPFSNSSGKYEGCLMYDYNYTAAAAMGYDAAMANRSSLGEGNSIKCYSRDFNFTQYQSTVVTEWDLVCERRALYSTTQSVVMAGTLLGCIVVGYLVDVLGRRRVVLFCSACYILASFLILAATNAETYIVFKFFISIMDTGQYISIFVFLMETTATKYRAAAGSLITVPWAMGYMLVPAIAYLVRTWRLLQVAYSVSTLWSIIYFVWLPESPRWLIVRGRYKEALKVLKRVAKTNDKTLPGDQYMMTAMANISQQQSAPKNKDEKPGVLRRIFMTVKRVLVLFILPQYRMRTLVMMFCWCSASMVYYGIALNANNINTDPYLYVFIGGLLEVPSYLLLWPASIYIGRRKSLVALYFMCALLIFLVMALLVVQPENGHWVVVVLSQGGKVAITAGYQLLWFYTAELYPTKYRSLAVGQSNMCASVGSVFSPYINDIMGVKYTWAPSALFGSVSLVSAAFTLMLPETGHLDLTELEHTSSTSQTQLEESKNLQTYGGVTNVPCANDK